MHEVSIMESTLKIVEDVAVVNNLKKVISITLMIGELSCVMEEALLFAFNSMSKDTVAENAAIKIESVKATASCEECNIVFDINHYNKLCPNCSCFCSSILTGNELYVKSIEGE